MLEQVAEAEARFAASCAEWDRRTLVQTGHHAMHAGLRGLLSRYNGQRVHARQFVALPAQNVLQHSASGSSRAAPPPP